MVNKFKEKINSKVLYSLIVVSVLLTVSIGVWASSHVTPNPGHDDDKIWIKSLNKTFEEVLNDGDFGPANCNNSYAGEVYDEMRSCTYKCGAKSGCSTGQQSRTVVCTEGNIEPILNGGSWTSCA